ncbi:hypothetical protein, partial [Trichocoleus sp. DQ-U1]|uniref:hypothetical protein n=1 Tax=Trichocoleus sp. DQ-U1 TaxID=2933926 RepID=UPI003298FDE0
LREAKSCRTTWRMRSRLRWLLKFKVICKSLGQDIHVSLESAIANWIDKQHLTQSTSIRKPRS